MGKKVLMVSCLGLGKGGVQAVMMGIVRSLHKEYCFDMIVFTEDKRYYEQEFLNYGGRIYRIPNYCGNNKILSRIDIYLRWIKNRRIIKRIITENGPYDVIHCNNEYESGYILKIAKECGVPVRICHTHSIIDDEGHTLRKWFNDFCRKRIRKYSTMLVGCSKAACEKMFDKSKFEVINNPYNEDLYKQEMYPQVYFTYPVLIQIGAYNDNKNQLFTIDVFNKVKKEYPSAKMIFVGFDMGFGYEDKLKERVEQMKLSDSVSFYPSDTNIASLLSKSCYMLMPSKKEGFGIVLIEAQAMGVRCFASDSIPKDTNVGGCLYLPLDKSPDFWAYQIVQDFKETEGKHGDYSCEYFTNEYVANKIRKLYHVEKII